MCGCKQKSDWFVKVYVDEYAMSEGYDGDLEPGTDTSEWLAYSLLSIKICSRCNDEETHDSLGSVWVLPSSAAAAYLAETVLQHGMVPKGAYYNFIWA